MLKQLTTDKTLSAKWLAYGDVNEDGVVNNDDAVHLMRYTMDSTRYPISDYVAKDMNGDHTVTSNDAIWIWSYVGGSISVLPYPYSVVSVSFNVNGGSGSMYNRVYEYGFTAPLPLCEFTAPTGKVFGGWATSAGGTVEYKDGGNFTVENNGTPITLYAKWLAYGDVDANGSVEAADRMKLAGYLDPVNFPGYEQYIVSMAAADVNLDGVVDTTDYNILQAHIAGDPEYATLPYTG